MSIKPWFRHLNKKVTEKPFAQMNYARPGFYNEPPPGSGQNVIGTESLYGQNFDIMDSDIPQTTMGDPPYKYPSLLSSKPSDVLAPKTNIQYQFLKNTPNPNAPQQLIGDDDERLGGRAYAVYRPDNDNLTRIEEDINYTNPYFMGPMMNLPPSVAGPIAVPKENLMNIPQPEEEQVDISQYLPEEPPVTMPEAITQGETGMGNMQVVAPDLSGAYDNAPEAQPPNAIPGVKFRAGKTMIDFTKPAPTETMPTEKLRTGELPPDSSSGIPQANEPYQIPTGPEPIDYTKDLLNVDRDPNYWMFANNDSAGGKDQDKKGFIKTLVDNAGGAIKDIFEAGRDLVQNNDITTPKTKGDVDQREGVPQGENIKSAANDYYKFQQMLNTAALASNLMQPGIPPIYYKNVMAKMMRHDRTQAELAKTQAKEAQANQLYQARMYGGGQQSGLLAGQAAVTSGTQKALRDISGQDKQMALGIDQQNMQANMQAAQINAENYNKNLMYNHQNAAEHARNLSAALSSNLQSIGKTAGEYAKFIESARIAKEMEAANREDVQAQNQLSKLTLQKQETERIMNSPEYAAAKEAAMKNFIQDSRKTFLEQDKYSTIKEDAAAEDVTEYIKFKQKYDLLRKSVAPTMPTPPEGSTSVDDETMKQYQLDLKKHEENIAEADGMKERYDLLNSYYQDINNDFMNKGYSDIFTQSYIHARGGKTYKEINQMLQGLLE